jgi:anaerobic magnesium-protoporphyrin IX monomethyl ester cyclase
MTKILFINPNKWGRGITTIWVASHSGLLKRNGHEVKLFDCTFYKDWTDNEVKLNTNNLQFKPTNYENLIKWNVSNLKESLQKTLDDFSPDVIFSSGISSHIHGEGEYINIQYAYEVLKDLKFKGLLIFGGLQSTSRPEFILRKMPRVDYLISGESELILNDIANFCTDKEKINSLNGVNFLFKNQFFKNLPQKIINTLDVLTPYDYSLFSKQTFLRPYNGSIVKAVDYEISRGCIYTCGYCVETVIQNYYNFNSKNKRGALLNAKSYLRNKSPKKILEEILYLYNQYNIELFRLQDTNFLTIDRNVLKDLSDLISNQKINIKLYIETRAEGINQGTIELLKKLKVDGVGMGVELSDEKFREQDLNRFVDHKKITKAFHLLRKNFINTTAYNIIGLPNQDEESIINTIKFNIKLNPNVSSVAYFSPYMGTDLELKSKGIFSEHPDKMDAQLRTKVKNGSIDFKILEFYKNNFNFLISNKLKDLEELKKKWIKNY